MTLYKQSKLFGALHDLSWFMLCFVLCIAAGWCFGLWAFDAFGPFGRGDDKYWESRVRQEETGRELLIRASDQWTGVVEYLDKED